MIALPALLLAACSHPPGLSSQPDRPNILLITLDTTRADHLGAYGYFRDTTPELDRIAAESIFFENMVAPMATTLPTHTSIFTGTHPLEHGVLANLKHTGHRFRASPSLRTFAQLVKGAGYETAAFVSAEPVKRGSGAEVGFGFFSQPDKAHRGAGQTTKLASRWIRKHNAGKDRPFFVWVHYFDPHGPFKPPEDFRRRFPSDAELDRWLEARGVFSLTNRPTGQVLNTRRSMNGYDGEIAFMDSQIGVLMERGRRQGWLDETLVVVAGDHGEGLGQHDMAGHGEVWFEQVHSPFLIRAPWREPLVVSRPVSAVDVLPTVLGLVDIPGEDAWLEQVSGLDLLKTGPVPVFSTTSTRQESLGSEERHALGVGAWRYQIAPDTERERLFHRGFDPHELVDLAATHPVQLAVLRSWTLEEVSRQIARGDTLGRGEPVVADEGTVEAMRTLGYLDDDETEE